LSKNILQTPAYIIAEVLISGNRVYRNGQMIFESPSSANAVAFLEEVYARFNIDYPKFYKMDSLCKLGFLAAELLLQEIRDQLSETETGVVLSNAHASLDVDLKYAKTIQTGASPALFVYTLPNIVIGEISIRHRLKGENAFFVFKHFDGNFTSRYVNGLLENGLIRNCICGWVDFLKESYRAELYFVSPEPSGTNLPFTAENIDKLNQKDNG